MSRRVNADIFVELRLYYRVRELCTDLLRAKNRPVVDDSEASSSESDNDEDQMDKITRRNERSFKKSETQRRVQRLKAQGDLPDLPKNQDHVDAIQAWMDDQNHIFDVRHISGDRDSGDKELTIPRS